jgi:hypothetical protein
MEAEMPEGPHELSPTEIAGQQAIDLPDREAMTLLSTMPTMPLPVAETDGGGLLPGGPASSTDPAAVGDDTLAAGTDAAGSESGGPTTTDADRSEQVVHSDSAYAGPG